MRSDIKHYGTNVSCYFRYFIYLPLVLVGVELFEKSLNVFRCLFNFIYSLYLTFTNPGGQKPFGAIDRDYSNEFMCVVLAFSDRIMTEQKRKSAFL